MRILFFSTLTIFFTFLKSDLSSQTYATGNYIGNGTSKSITGLGFSPECVMIKSNNAYEAVIAHTNHSSGKTKAMGTSSVALATGQVTSLDANGFTVGSGNSTNSNGVVYQYIAWNESTNIHIGTYTGNGSAPSITGCGFQPEAAIIWGDEASASGDVAFILDVMGTGSSEGFFTYTTSITSTADYVNTWTATGWTGGNATNSPDNNGVNYYYIAFNESGTTIKENSWTANNGADNYSVTDMGFQPDFLVVYSPTAQTQAPVFRIGSVSSSTDKSFQFTATASASNLIQSFAASGFSAGNDNKVNYAWQTHHYFATSGGTALPVQLTSFEAQKDGNNVFLHWQTGSEINSDRFEIMHSTDGTNFELIGSVPAAGSSSTWLDYEFYHENPGKGLHYYQLVEFDQDGTSEKFKTLTIDFNDAFNIITQLYPNPTSNNLNLYYNSREGGTYQLTITNANGTVVYHAQIPTMIGDNKFLLPLSSYASGTYYITLSDPANNKSSVQFVKQD